MSNGEIRVSITEISKIREALEKADKEIERLNKERNKTYENGLNYFLELQEKNEEIERLHSIINKVIADIEDVRDKNNYYDDYKVDNSILTYWIDLLKGSDKE